MNLSYVTLQDLKDQIYETCYEILRIEMHKISEKLKLESRIKFLNNHQQAFDEMFEKGLWPFYLRINQKEG